MTLDFSALDRDGFCTALGVRDIDLLRLIEPLGRVRVDPRNPEPVRDIQPQQADAAKPNTLSSRYGTGGFPFHTDTAHWDRPARYLLLYCVSPGDGMRPTRLQDSRAWQLTDQEMDLACRALWAVGHRRVRLAHLAVRVRGRLLVRYDMDCMRPMTSEASELKALLQHRIETTVETSNIWEPGSLLVIDNHRMVHARGVAPKPDANRLLKRILIGES